MWGKKIETELVVQKRRLKGKEIQWCVTMVCLDMILFTGILEEKGLLL